ncbi:MAG: thrombospondin type 3 repeat-containing protein [Acidobacteriota bacterium]
MSRLVILILALAAVLVTADWTCAAPLPGQVIRDPDNPQWLRRHEGPPVFLAGFGDPEEFLYFGRAEGADGRGAAPPWNAEQAAILDRIVDHGGNSMYFILDRRPGHHQPFLGGRSINGADPAVLDHFMSWFDVLEANDIVIHLFFYDDGTGGDPDVVEPHEEMYWRQVVNHYEHYRNLVWVLTEEQTDRYFSYDKAVAWSEVVADADDHDHVISTHVWDFWETGYGDPEVFAFAGAGGFNWWLFETRGTSGLSVDEHHAQTVRKWRDARATGHGVTMAEFHRGESLASRGADLRRSNWAFGMAGVGTLWLYPWSTTDPRGFTPTVTEQRYLRDQQVFFEGTDFYTMSPRDELAFADTDWVLADVGRSAIVYSNERSPTNLLGLRDTPAGVYFIRWLDIVSGRVVEETGRTSPGGNVAWPVPIGFGEEVAAWIVSDPDGDGVVDTRDETDICPEDHDPDQLDGDMDGIGDACDECPMEIGDDNDGDAICSGVDNCDDVANVDQSDLDGDGIGDACDTCPEDADDDIDGDGLCADVDNCPEIDNRLQLDSDGDLVGDTCDPCRYDPLDDVDGDGFCANIDNCPETANLRQVDLDSDGNGDACDPCPLDADDDIDADGHCGDLDNCPDLANAEQGDLDADGIGDDCDPDLDGDGTENELDCAPANPGDTELVPPIGDLRLWWGPDGRTPVMGWSPAPFAMTDPEATHELLVGLLDELLVDRGFDRTCLMTHVAETRFEHRSPRPMSEYYLIRGLNDCGPGRLLQVTVTRAELERVVLPACP